MPARAGRTTERPSSCAPQRPAQLHHFAVSVRTLPRRPGLCLVSHRCWRNGCQGVCEVKHV
eukprot:853446-Alexandrium_andersonii.AAC.1